jgi:hypothetical protein
MSQESKNFTIYSLRYQILLAQHIAKIYNEKVYIFDSVGFFDNDTEIITIDSIRTLFKKNHRAVLNATVKAAFGTNEKLFLEYVDQNVLEKDNIGLYVVPIGAKLQEPRTEDMVPMRRTDALSPRSASAVPTDESDLSESELSESESDESENLKKDLEKIKV